MTISKLSIFAKYIDQPVVLSKLHSKMPAILIGGGGAFAMTDTYRTSKHVPKNEKKNHLLRNSIVFASTVGSLLLVAKYGKLNGEKILGGETLKEVLESQKKTIDKYLKRMPEIAKNTELAAILNKTKKTQLSKNDITVLLEKLPVTKGDEKIKFSEAKNIINNLNDRTNKEKYEQYLNKMLLDKILPGNKDLSSKEIFSEIGRLSILGLTPVAGGVAGGIIADKVTHTDTKKRTANKVKEGLYQFLANIFLCNVGAGAALFLYEGLVKGQAIKPTPGKKLGAILSGIVTTGIIGGSYIANYVSKKYINPIFDGKEQKIKSRHAHKHHRDIYSERKPEALDVALHADDIATASVLAGFKWIEPVLPLMYFVSGYRAGTGYRNNDKSEKIVELKKQKLEHIQQHKEQLIEHLVEIKNNPNMMGRLEQTQRENLQKIKSHYMNNYLIKS